MRTRTRRHCGGRPLVIGLLAVLLVVQGCARSDEDRSPVVLEPVVLKITNKTENDTLRCQLLLAHFMTGDAAQATTGWVIEVGMLREVATSTLLYLGPGDRLVAVENMLCGADDDWQATRKNIDLTPLRAGGTRLLQITCTDRGGLFCTADATAKD